MKGAYGRTATLKCSKQPAFWYRVGTTTCTSDISDGCWIMFLLLHIRSSLNVLRKAAEFLGPSSSHGGELEKRSCPQLSPVEAIAAIWGVN